MPSTSTHPTFYGDYMNKTQAKCAASFLGIGYQHNKITINETSSSTIYSLNFLSIFQGPPQYEIITIEDAGLDNGTCDQLFWINFNGRTTPCATSKTTCTVFAPDVVPFELLAPFGTFSKNLAYNHPDLLYKGWWLACAIHLSEALVALKLCSNKGIKDMSTRCLWFIQTFLFGFASLHLLIKYDPERSKQD
ncbi:transmembrane protein 254-like [Pelmatolapia mariae]|uniref:transmembrane protein 254-like n=1 Tax=Pelmatolapia mariae TaxID=158779 RepID=UPI003211E63E